MIRRTFQNASHRAVYRFPLAHSRTMFVTSGSESRNDHPEAASATLPSKSANFENSRAIATSLDRRHSINASMSPSLLPPRMFSGLLWMISCKVWYAARVSRLRSLRLSIAAAACVVTNGIKVPATIASSIPISSSSMPQSVSVGAL